MTVASVISGNGTLTQAGNGTVTLTANNTYTGNTTISAGTLQAGNGNATGTLGTGAVTDYAALIFDTTSNITAASAISGNGTLSQAGNGTVNLTGNNTAFAGNTTISAGTLQIGSGISLGTGAVMDNAALTFNTTANITVANVISGNGTLTQAGNGTLTLTGNNTYLGNTTISAGKLQIGTGVFWGRPSRIMLPWPSIPPPTSRWRMPSAATVLLPRPAMAR